MDTLENKTIKNIYLNIWYTILFLTNLFPYVSFIKFGTDIQPWGLIISLMHCCLIFYYSLKIKRIFLYPLIVLNFAFVFLIFSKNYFEGLRSFLGYMSFFFIPLAFFHALKNRMFLFIKILKSTTVIYLIAAFIQQFSNVNIFNSILNRVSTTAERGVTSLAPEPTFYGIICIFFLLIFLKLNIKNKLFYEFLIIFQIVFLARSSMCIIFLLILLLLYIFFNSSSFGRAIMIILPILFFSFFSLINIEIPNDKGIRFISLLNLFVKDPFNVIFLDASINNRLSAIYFSFKGFINNFFLPHGFGSYAEYLTSELSKQTIFPRNIPLTNRILSFYGTCLFELGFIGLLIPAFINKCIYISFAEEKTKLYIHLAFLNLLLLSAIPLSFSLLGVYLAVLLVSQNSKGQNHEM